VAGNAIANLLVGHPFKASLKGRIGRKSVWMGQHQRQNESPDFHACIVALRVFLCISKPLLLV
jgi:hypothetical protein